MKVADTNNTKRYTLMTNQETIIAEIATSNSGYIAISASTATSEYATRADSTKKLLFETAQIVT